MKLGTRWLLGRRRAPVRLGTASSGAPADGQPAPSSTEPTQTPRVPPSSVAVPAVGRRANACSTCGDDHFDVVTHPGHERNELVSVRAGEAIQRAVGYLRLAWTNTVSSS
jgi:hypothetical protein